MFGKKPKSEERKQVCCNLPGEIVSDYDPDSSGEVVQFYLVPLTAIFEHEGKEFYDHADLVRFPQEDRSEGYPFNALEMFSGGKCTLWKTGAKGDEEVGLAPNTVVFQTTSAKELKFSPAFFKILAHKKMALLRVSSHKDWHWDRAYNHYPNITKIWKPAYAEQILSEILSGGTPAFTPLQPTARQ